MRVVFFGNHTVGVKVLEAIAETEEVVGIVAHPPDPEDGIRYLSVYDVAVQRGWRAIRSTGKDPTLKGFIRAVKPDLSLIADYRYLLPSSLLTTPLGVVNLHPSLLPKYRGRAPINWAILNGEKTLGLTAHFVDEGMDTGDIIAQVNFELNEHQDVADALQILYPLYSQITRKVLKHFRSGHVPRRPQDHSQATVFPRRKPEDGIIDWRQPVHSIWNLVRAVAYPYPGAFSTLAGRKLIVWNAHPSRRPLSTKGVPGMVLFVTPEGQHVQCGDGVLLLTRVEFAQNEEQSSLQPGVVIGNR